MDGHFSVGKMYIWDADNPYGSVSYIVYLGNHYDMFSEKSQNAFIQKGDTIVVLDLYAGNAANGLIQDIKVLTGNGDIGWIRVHRYHFYQWHLVQ